jgi:hypothetical protein
MIRATSDDNRASITACLSRKWLYKVARATSEADEMSIIEIFVSPDWEIKIFVA